MGREADSQLFYDVLCLTIPMGRKSIVMVEPCEFAEASPCRENMVASGAYRKTLPRHEQESHHYGGLISFVQETR